MSAAGLVPSFGTLNRTLHEFAAASHSLSAPFAQWYLLGLAARDAAVDDVVRHGAEPARGHDGEGAADEAGDPEIRLLEELELFSGIASCGHAAYVAHN